MEASERLCIVAWEKKGWSGESPDYKAGLQAENSSTKLENPQHLVDGIKSRSCHFPCLTGRDSSGFSPSFFHIVAISEMSIDYT
jgi:hypothetical protein